MSGSGFKKVAKKLGTGTGPTPGRSKPVGRPLSAPPPKPKSLSQLHPAGSAPADGGRKAGEKLLTGEPRQERPDKRTAPAREAGTSGKAGRGPGCAIVALACVAALLLSCSLFDPRDPEDPDETPPFWQYPYSPAIVMLNVHGSMEARSITLYMACMDTSFAFLADPADTSEWGGSWEFDDWDYYVEQNTMGNIFALQDTIYGDTLVAVTFMGVEGYPDPPAPVDSAQIWRDYTVVVAPSIWGPYGNPARGRARITMVESSTSTWSISLWEDFRPEFPDTSHTLGVLKASFR